MLTLFCMTLRRLLLPVSLMSLMTLLGCAAAHGDAGLTLDPGDPGVDEGDAAPPGNDDGGFPGDPGGLKDAGGGKPLDPTKDNDGDGYLYADDCNDANPLVNPGAYDVPGDGVDNDCNGKIDDVDACDSGLAMTSGNAMDFAKSLGLCRQTSASATGKARTWGVIRATLKTTDGVGAPLPMQYGIQSAWGSAVKPKAGASMAVLSTGSARTPAQAGYFKPRSYDGPTTHENTPPAGWPINSAGCPEPTKKTANDSVVLELVIRVPTNAKSFSYDFDFYTAEYIEFVCSEFNDTYAAILKSKVPLDPKNAGNVSFDKKGDPVNVNSGFFEVCSPASKAGRTFPCAMGRGELSATGYDVDGTEDGATGWLETKAAVVPGEEITISFMIWNTGDHELQSAVLLDDWRWGAEGTTGPTTTRPK